MRNETIIIDVFLVKIHMKIVFYEIDNLLHNLRNLKHILHGLLFHLSIDKMQGNESRFVLWKTQMTFLFNQVQRPQTNLKFFFVKSPDIPEQGIFHSHTIQQPQNCAMHMVDQGNINHIV